jgi:hypothetical protein
VTCQFFYSPFGNSAKGLGNNYAYGARAVGANSANLGVPGVPFIGLGASTPMPGINEGSPGLDSVVKDSKGNAQLYPDPSGDTKYVNLVDVEVGDFLDTIFFDQNNPYVHTSLHASVVGGGDYGNNYISTPPTPNPPPLSIPVAMRPTHVMLDKWDLTDEGAFVIVGKEVFSVDLSGAPVPPQFTGFVHLNPVLPTRPLHIRTTIPALS